MRRFVRFPLGTARIRLQNGQPKFTFDNKMNLLKVGLLFASVLFAFTAHAERQIAEIFQPTSL
jgi:hypothetical protein